MMHIALVDYGSGNLRSVAKAFERAAADLGLAATIAVTDRPEAIAAADRIVLPGVGAFGDCAAGLGRRPGLRDALSEAAIKKARPFFGICVGMQLMATCGVEFGRHQGLGWLNGEITPLVPADPELKLPHMGWNDLTFTGDHALMKGLKSGTHVYFVHSFAWSKARARDILAEADYGGTFPAMIGCDNLIGTQFHPEKSQAAGLTLIANFLNWRP